MNSVIYYVIQIQQSRTPSAANMKEVIYSLLTMEGSLKSQMVYKF